MKFEGLDLSRMKHTDLDLDFEKYIFKQTKRQKVIRGHSLDSLKSSYDTIQKKKWYLIGAKAEEQERNRIRRKQEELMSNAYDHISEQPSMENDETLGREPGFLLSCGSAKYRRNSKWHPMTNRNSLKKKSDFPHLGGIVNHPLKRHMSHARNSTMTPHNFADASNGVNQNRNSPEL